MNFCIGSPGPGRVCLGDFMNGLHEAGMGMTAAGISIFAVVALCVFAFIFGRAA